MLKQLCANLGDSLNSPIASFAMNLKHLISLFHLLYPTINTRILINRLGSFGGNIQQVELT